MYKNNNETVYSHEITDDFGYKWLEKANDLYDFEPIYDEMYWWILYIVVIGITNTNDKYKNIYWWRWIFITIKIKDFSNNNDPQLLNPRSQTYTPPQTPKGNGDCTYWVEAAILVLNEIIPKNSQIDLNRLSTQLMSEKIQEQIQKTW